MKSTELCKVSLDISSTLDYCGTESEREIILTVNIGEVTSADSLYGYTFQIKYDTNLINFTDMLYYGTLSENCYFKHGSTMPGGCFRISAVNIDNTMLIGNKPLAAIKGIIKANCSIDTEIQSDFIEFTQEYTRDSIELNDIQFNIVKADKEDRALKIKSRQDSINLKIDKKIDLYIEKQYSNLNEIILEFTGDIGLLNMETIKPFSSDYQAEIISQTADIVRIKIHSSKIIYYGDLISIDAISTADTNINANIKVEAKIGDCECITRIYPANVKLVKIKEPDNTGIVSEKKSYNKIYYLDEGILKLNQVYNNIKIFDRLGVLLFESDNNYEDKIVVNNINNAGVYFGLLNGNEINRIIIIKN